MQPAGFIITLTCVVASMVIFRSPNLKTAGDLLQGMLGLHGIGLSGLRSGVGVGLKTIAFWIGAPAFIALVCPNTLQMLSQYEPALGWKATGPRPSAGFGSVSQGATTAEPRILWGPSLAWAAAVSLIAAIGILYVGGQSEFLYWQF